MSEIKEQFVTYEIALKLKELGFDEPCFGYYTPMKYWMISTNPKYNSEPHYIGPNWCTEDMKMRFMFVTNTFGDRDSVVKNSEFTKAIHNVVVPLWQQVIDWIYNNYKILIYPHITPDKIMFWVVKSNVEDFYSKKEYAFLKAIKLCQKEK